MVKRSSRSLSPARIDRDYPHQVALPDDLCCDRNYTLIDRFLKGKGLPRWTRRVQAVWPDGGYVDMRLYCFADREAAMAFQAHFGGEMFSPSRDRENGRTGGIWRREGKTVHILESGPLSVPEILRN